MNRQNVAILKSITRVLSGTGDAPCGKGWKNPQTWALVSSRRRTRGCAFGSSCRFCRDTGRVGPGCSQFSWQGQPGCELRAAELCPGLCRLPLAGLRWERSEALSKGQSLPASSLARGPLETAQQSFEANGNSAQSARSSWLSGEDCSNLIFI